MESLKDALKDSVDAFRTLSDSIKPAAKPFDPAYIPDLADDGVSRRRFMAELMAGGSFSSDAPGLEPAPVTVMPGGKRIIPVRAVKEVSMREMTERRKFFSPDQLNEQIVQELLRPLVEQLDEMGLIDFEVKRDKDRLLYSITLNVVKDERG